jgi:predicted dehydrogenase
MTAKSKIRVGIIGAGNWAKYGHIPVLLFLPAIEIVAVASRSKQSAEELARQFSIRYAFDNPEELITHPEVDLVIILPPAPHHAALARAAIAAGKDVYCEWPLTTNINDTKELQALAEAAGVKHLVGLQRRLGPSARYVRDLLEEDYVGKIRSVRMHVSMNYFQQLRPKSLEWTVPAENFSHILAIYGGHFLDMLFNVAGQPKTVSAEVLNQFPTVTIVETAATYPNTTPDEVVLIGTLENGAAFSIQIEGGKRNNSGLQIDITGHDGDLKIWNPLSFGNGEDNRIEGSQGDNQDLVHLPIPERYQWVTGSTLDASVLDLAHLYTGYAEGRDNVPNFTDAVKMHQFIDLISKAAATGTRQTVDFW